MSDGTIPAQARAARASRSTSRAPPSTASSRSSCARAVTSRAATAAPARVQGTPSFPPAQFTARPSSGGRRRAAGCSARARAALSPEPLRSAELWQRPQRAALDTPRCARERQGQGERNPHPRPDREQARAASRSTAPSSPTRTSPSSTRARASSRWPTPARAPTAASSSCAHIYKPVRVEVLGFRL